MAIGHLEFLWPDRPVSRHAVPPQPTGVTMLDVIMLAIGIGSFALLFAYVALCERL
jgi:hypothetical protein